MPAGGCRLALKLAAIVAVLFGIATVASGGGVLFGGGAEAAGNYVPFIVWFNFLAVVGRHIGAGGAYENRTLAAMTLRLVVWGAIAALALRLDLSQRQMRRA